MTFLRNMKRPALGILAGAVFTGLVQSSAATVGIAIAMATEGLLTLQAGIALALGANISTCVINTLLFIGLTPWFARAAIKLYPRRTPKDGIVITPNYLDPAALALPAVALEQVRREFGRMGQIAAAMLSELPRAILEKDKQHVDIIVMLDDKVDILESAIFEFLFNIGKLSLTTEESRIHQDLMTATVNLETLADVIETDLSIIAVKVIDRERSASKVTQAILVKLYGEVHRSVELAVKSIRDTHRQAATQVLNKKAYIDEMAESLLTRKSEHLGRGRTEQLGTARIEIPLINKMQRTYDLARRIARIVSPAAPLRHH
jgi:phosphate:Na+ symporter